MSFPYKNPISSIQANGTQTVPRNNTYGTTFSVNNTGGYMEVFSLSDLYYTIPSGTTGSIEYSGNTIPIEFTKGTGAAWSPDVITLASDNISSGRRRLGMLAYVYEVDKFINTILMITRRYLMLRLLVRDVLRFLILEQQ